MTHDDKIIEKIRALLAKTERGSGATEGEATAAAEKAQELMLRYGIELARVAESKSAFASAGVGHEKHYGGVDPWRRILAEQVARAMGGSTVWQADYRKWTGWIDFWGPRGSVPGMIALYEYLEAQLLTISALEVPQARARGELAPGPGPSMRYRRSFLMGAVHRLTQRLKLRQQEIENESVDNSMALVVIRDAVADAKSDFYDGGLRNKKVKANVDPTGYARGQERAEHVDLGDPQLKNRNAEIARRASPGAGAR